MDNEYMSITSESEPNKKTLENNSVTISYEYFEDIKRKVDLRREDLIQRIHNYSDEIIKSVDSTQLRYSKMSQEVEELKIEVENSKSYLNGLVSRFDSCEKKQKSVFGLNESFCKVLEEYKESSLGFSKYSFDFKEIDIKEIFRSLIETEKLKFDSKIVDIEMQKQLVNLCEFSVSQKWELKYRASRDGFKASDFHYNCDDIGNTITVVKAKSGNVFGGFTEQKWHSRGEWVTDPNAFIFSLVNKKDKPFKAMCKKGGKETIFCDSRFGPCFGGDTQYVCDILIKTDSNKKKESYCDFGYDFHHPDYEKGTDEAKNILAGSYKFETVEIEVFAKTD